MLLEYHAVFQSINIARWSIVSQDAASSCVIAFKTEKQKRSWCREYPGGLF